jgi:serine phosphatase RsbU (regulator of sigma subunit)
VVTVCDDLLGNQFASQRERDLLLMGYLNQAARAWQAVSDRRRELELAGRMQASLLPDVLPELPGWQLQATFRPARETSGDFYDFIPLPDGQLGIVVADVADKGMGAALYMALTRTLIRTYAVDFLGRPDLALQAVNDRILAETGADLFVTVFLAMLDRANSTVTYCNAGHHPPYWLQPSAGSGLGGEELIKALPGTGIALGVVRTPDWGRSTIGMEPGATLLLYTDGVVDAHNAEQARFGNEGILAAVRQRIGEPARKLQDEILTSLQQFTGDQPQFDDITLVVVQREEETGD